jgi:hypothetical protein
VEYFEIALILYPTDPTNFFERAKLHSSLKAYDAALRDLDKAIELAGSWWAISIMRAPRCTATSASSRRRQRTSHGDRKRVPGTA